MAKHGKKYLAARAKVDSNTNYEPFRALELVKETAYAGFDGTVEVHMHTGLDPRQADQQVRGGKNDYKLPVTAISINHQSEQYFVND